MLEKLKSRYITSHSIKYKYFINTKSRVKFYFPAFNGSKFINNIFIKTNNSLIKYFLRPNKNI